MKLSTHPRFHASPPSVSNTHHAPSRGAGASPKRPINGLSLPLLGLASTLLWVRNFAERRLAEVGGYHPAAFAPPPAVPSSAGCKHGCQQPDPHRYSDSIALRLPLGLARGRRELRAGRALVGM